MSDIELETIAVHESGHACCAMHLGVVPSEIVVSESGGEVNFDKIDSRHSSMLIGLSGSCAVRLFLGDDADDEASQEDLAMVSRYFRTFHDYHPRMGHDALMAAESLCWGLENQILALANQLLVSPRMDRMALGRFVRTHPEMAAFEHLFPAPRPKPKTLAMRKPSPRSPGLPRGFSFRVID
jgi:hypothetical protein